jgi:hypothetical protein
MIKLEEGLERLLIMMTGLREYRCRDCEQRFRAPDRRTGARNSLKGRIVHQRQAA